MSGLFRRRRKAVEPLPPPDAGSHTAEIVLPAGTDLDELVGSPPVTRRRSRLRRRARHLRSAREVLLRDLGGMVFEVHRAAAGPSDAVAAKLQRLAVLDSELRELETLLDDHRGMVVREPGIGGVCPNCSELYGSDARFCWACGIPVAPGAQRPAEAIRPALASTVVHVEGTGIELPPPPPPPPPPPS